MYWELSGSQWHQGEMMGEGVDEKLDRIDNKWVSTLKCDITDVLNMATLIVMMMEH